ncbi:alternate F1F0 ATPase, F1 subunit alpha [Desulfogranum japonicum]|uniref:alternate F1F0 ATPase, F1 subunit alpha n=1 Tax=Desulfogranum japonicum TaxID=231447 RepID=UPI00041C9809|nr:alternate F1F0 ATPase, F1 subunit alpha [Desulfogranum japonicum]
MAMRELQKILEEVTSGIDGSLDSIAPAPKIEEVGRIRRISQGIIWAEGLNRVQSEELVIFGDKATGLVLDILPDRIGIVLLDNDDCLKSGDEVSRTGKVLDVPVHNELVGRIIDPLGNPLDDKPRLPDEQRLPVQREAPAIMDRAPVDTPLQTGIKVIDALVPIGRGQRELILGDRQTGKTAVAVDTIINQRGRNIICIYCAIGQRSSSVAKVIDDLQRNHAMDHTIVVVAEGNDAAGLQYIAPYAATSIGEFFMGQGHDVLVVYDDITRHAQAYRQICLLLRRPPGREAFPGDIFYIHSRLLERSTHLREERGGGSLTALPIIETEAQNISAYIPTNLISITDGQVYLSPDLFQKGQLPAVEVGKSVSRVGGKAQLPAYRKVAGELRLSYSQYQELESFSRFGTRLDDDTRRKLVHGRRVRELLKQDQYDAQAEAEQIAVLFGVIQGLFDNVPLRSVAMVEKKIIELVRGDPDLAEVVRAAGKQDQIWDTLKDRLIHVINAVCELDEHRQNSEQPE